MRRFWLLLSSLLLLCACAGARPADDPPPERFEADIAALEKRPARPGGTLFLGSSTWTLWGADLETTLAEFHAVNSGFGGSTIPDVDFFLERLLRAERPRLVVFYAGTNDLASGHSPARVAADFRRLVEHARRLQPGVQVWFVSASVAPCRWALRHEFDELNREVKAWTQDQPDLGYVDVSGLTRDAQGRPRPDLYREDQLHMTPAGYALWTPVLRQALAAWWQAHVATQE